MGGENSIKAVAVIGAGAAGTITAAALKAENYFDRIHIFERRETAGGTWIFDPSPGPELPVRPGKIPPQIDPPVEIPNGLPKITSPCEQERFSKTPVYEALTTNVPDVAMCFSDQRFAYGPFPPHYVPRQYLENYVALHKLDEHLVLGTTVEDVSKLPASKPGSEKWKLTLRKHDVLRSVDIWWTEIFDAVVIANGHYSVPFIPHVDGLEDYIKKFPNRVVHSKYYRSPSVYTGQKVLTIGNSASGWDIMHDLTKTANLPVYNSRRSRGHFEGDKPDPGLEWKGVITRYHLDGTIEFDDGTTLAPGTVDKIVYCTGYRPSFPFWNVQNNGRPFYDYDNGKLVNNYWHTFCHDYPTVAIVGIQKSLTFRSFEYQAIALARLFAGRNVLSLPPVREMQAWETKRLREVQARGTKFHDIETQIGGLTDATFTWLGFLYQLSGLGTLKGDGRIPPALSKDLLWALKNIRKYPDPGAGKQAGDTTMTNDKELISDVRWNQDGCSREADEDEWIVIPRRSRCEPDLVHDTPRVETTT